MPGRINELGMAADLRFMSEPGWLNDTAVSSRIVHRYSRWHLWLVFVSANNPCRFIARYIDHYPTRHLAGVYSTYFLKSARRDERGTFVIDEDAFNICLN
ncbi:MAG: hypothetical protein SFV52_06205 [Saprospiraceae bacterium]|nr:hypothetical protein [Saprospiraceae bacterium]